MKYVYMLRSERGLYKIGAATNPYHRLKAIQTSNSDLIEIVATKFVSDAHASEHKLHKMLSEFTVNGGREWFKLTPEQALSVTVELNKSPALGINEIEFIKQTLLEAQEKEEKVQNEIDDKRLTTYKRITYLLEQYYGEKTDPIKSKKIIEKPIKPSQEELDSVVYAEAKKVIAKEGRASTSLLQRKLRIGYGRASRIMEQLEEQGIIGAADGSRARVVLTPQYNHILSQL